MAGPCQALQCPAPTLAENGQAGGKLAEQQPLVEYFLQVVVVADFNAAVGHGHVQHLALGLDGGRAVSGRLRRVARSLHNQKSHLAGNKIAESADVVGVVDVAATVHTIVNVERLERRLQACRV